MADESGNESTATSSQPSFVTVTAMHHPDQRGHKKRTTSRGGRRHSRAHKESSEASNIINLLKRQLSDKALLAKGLSFMPSKRADLFKTQVELFKFFRTVKLTLLFCKNIVLSLSI